MAHRIEDEENIIISDSVDTDSITISESVDTETLWTEIGLTGSTLIYRADTTLITADNTSITVDYSL